MIFKYFNGESLLIPKIAMKIGGIWPLDRAKRGSLIVFVIASALKIALSITGLIGFYQNLGPKLEVFMTCLVPVIVFLRFLSIRMNSDGLIRVIESKIDNSLSVKNPKEREIMKRLEIFAASFFVVMIINFFIIPLVRLVRWFPFYHDTKFSVEQQIAVKDHYIWLSGHSVFYWSIMLTDSFVAYGTLMLFWSLNTHLTGQLKILKRHFQQFLRIKNEDKSRRRFRRLVDKHNQLLTLCDDVENSFSAFLAMEVTIRQTAICYLAYQFAVAKLNGNWTESTDGIEVIAFNTWALFVFYYSGECLSTCSEEIGDVFKGCKWYNLSKESRINFSIVILQSQRPKKLTIAGLYKLTLFNFTYLVQSLYSYISLIVAIAK